mgnify:CR=1 FL=1
MKKLREAIRQFTEDFSIGDTVEYDAGDGDKHVGTVIGFDNRMPGKPAAKVKFSPKDKVYGAQPFMNIYFKDLTKLLI